MSNEALQTEVAQVIGALAAIATNPVHGFGDGYKQIGVNFSIAACDAAAAITGCDATFCRMMNYEFRSDAAQMMMELAA